MGDSENDLCNIPTTICDRFSIDNKVGTDYIKLSVNLLIPGPENIIKYKYLPGQKNRIY